VGLEAGARGAPASAGRQPQHLPGPRLEAAARREEVEPREGRPAGALRPGAAGVGRQHEGDPTQDGEGERWEELERDGGKKSCKRKEVERGEKEKQRTNDKIFEELISMKINLLEAVLEPSIVSHGLPQQIQFVQLSWSFKCSNIYLSLSTFKD